MISVLKKTIKEKGFTYKSLSEKIINKYEYQISKESIAKYAGGSRTPEPKLLIILSDILNVSIDYLLGNNNKINNFIPLIGPASCCKPQEYSLNGYELIPVDSRTYSEGMYAVEAEGNSMSPKITNGNILYCSPSKQVENGNIVHYEYNGESGIKRYKINDSQTIISLIPINSDHDIITIDEFQASSLSMIKVTAIIDTDV